MQKRTGIQRILYAGTYAIKGLKYNLINEASFRQEAILAIFMIPAACLLPVSTVERILLIGSVVLVLIVELLNTGIEAVVDRIGLEIHPLSGQAKDAGSAAVFLSLIFLVFVVGNAKETCSQLPQSSMRERAEARPLSSLSPTCLLLCF